ncbi:MAG: isoleucine--tRNA ligase [Deltaproteobacteria bacterium]|nr:isoleucine--tRNA ligase [Deltaproteobacteria bacterium]
MSAKSKQNPYPEVESQPSFPALERAVLEFWRRDKIFEASVEGRPAGDLGSNEFVFYDGPPFANGLPHYGHLLTGYVKDVIPRYQTLRGRRVERRFGWDCHGLPAEMEAERELGISGHAKIEEYGVENFNAFCRASVMKYTEQWIDTVQRQARWVDFRNDYKTMDRPYMESVMWAVKTLWDKGLLYEGYRVMPYSWAAETPVSNFETRLDDSYHDRQDPAITVRFALEPLADGEKPTELWVWTTTPWTLPSNLAIAVGPEIEYAVYDLQGRRIILGEAAAAKYEAELAEGKHVSNVRGRELVGRRYKPLFPFFEDTEGAFRVLGADFVDTEEGTGAVHMAPGFGEEDLEACQEADIPVVCPVDERGRFTAEVPTWQGENVLEANKPIVRELKEREVLIRHETYTHSYPHCWRTGEPLIYKAMTSWYVRVTDIRDRMVELNRGIHWIPEHFRDGQMGRWLEGARDWSISRNRFWGSPIPIWRSDDPAYPRIDVYGSIAELEADFGVTIDDLHRPEIDGLVRANPDDPTGKSMMRRVPDVLDCWFESGSMPYAQVHYPFENREWFDNHSPADFVTEYVSQTRGWFYTMMVLSTALFDRAPFKNCICHGIVLDENGQKLSKRLRNYPGAEEVFETYGSDALRWFMLSAPILRGGNLQIDREGQRIREVVRLVINPIWNAYYFFCLYANSEGIEASFRTNADGPLDRYIVSKTRRLVLDVQDAMDAYDLPSACALLTSWVDGLNNWYIRRSRPRFWQHADEEDARAAYDTLYTVLVTFLRVASPLLPMLTEEIFRGLTGERSVHLGDWPDVSEWPEDEALVGDMDRVREVCTAALALRRAQDVRVRQPLRTLTVAGPWVQRLEPYASIIGDEVNVKRVVLETDVGSYATFRLRVNARVLGKRLGKKMQPVIQASKKGEWRQVDARSVEVAGETLTGDDYSVLLEPREGVTCQALSSNDAIAMLDLEIDADLEREGRARDIVRVIQQARREADLDVSDRIRLVISAGSEWREAVGAFRDYIAEQTLALQLDVEDSPERDGYFVHEAWVGGESVRVGLTRAA